MVQNFDDILKSGKAKVISNVNKTKKELFKEYVTNLLSLVHLLNELYENNQHNITVGNNNCKKCGRPTFTLTVKNIDNISQAIRFHKSNWKSEGHGTYYCENCRKI